MCLQSGIPLGQEASSVMTTSLINWRILGEIHDSTNNFLPFEWTSPSKPFLGTPHAIFVSSLGVSLERQHTILELLLQ